MSRLSVFWPDEISLQENEIDVPRILPFPGVRSKAIASTAPMDVVTRARILFSNRACVECGYPVVEPLELPDSTVNLSGLAIPGTATLVGFRCCGCDHEWSI
jgi:hypothetical protein